MSISEKIKTIDNKIEQNKIQYDLDRQTAKISALSSVNVSKYGFLTGKDVLPEKDFLEKAATMKIFEYSPLGKELKKQSSVAENLTIFMSLIEEKKKNQQLKNIIDQM